jgi:nucleotide-binding universal stress UspA family protein
MVKKILVPLDGSALAERAIQPALALARQDGAEVVFMRVPVMAHMFIPAEGGYGLLYPEQSLGASREETQVYLDEMQRVWAGSNYSVRAARVEGDVPSAIVDTARHENVDLIVISSHGYSGITRWVMGSVAEKVLHGAHCPVLVIRANQPLRRMLITLDGSLLAEKALDPAFDVARALNAQITLLRVAPDISEGELADLDEVERGLGRRLQQEVADEAEAYLKHLADRLPADLTVDVAMRMGAPAAAILHFAELHDIDLIAMATHGRAGLGRWLYGSVTEKILRTVPCSMLVVRPAEQQLK